MADKKWTANDVPHQNGRLAVVTGGNSGVGFETARALARRGAAVILAVRDEARGSRAVDRIESETPAAQVEVMRLDLADLASVQAFADAFLARHASLPLLINNAGVMALPYRRTADGFEMQFGTNHLGHFALTGLLLPALLAAPSARIVTVSSGMHQLGSVDFDNLDGSQGYQEWRAYSQSKLANLLFAYELQRRLTIVGASAISVGAHPGFAATNLQTAAARMTGSRVREWLNLAINTVFAQSAAMGALPILYAATALGVNGCDYIGPTGLTRMRGYPGKVRSSAKSYDVGTARLLWQVSEDLTGVHYETLNIKCSA